MTIDQRITILETKFNERWDAHDKRSEDIWSEVRQKIDYLVDKVNRLPCGRITEKVNNLEKAFGWVWGFIIPVVVGIMGIAFKVFLTR